MFIVYIECLEVIFDDILTRFQVYILDVYIIAISIEQIFG